MWWTEEFRRLERRMEELFHEMTEMEKRMNKEFGGIGAQTPKTDVIETEDEVIVTMEIPGVEKKDIKVTVEGNILKVEAKQEKREEEKKPNYLRKERYYSSYARTITLPEYVDENSAKAIYKNGVLTITFKKRKEKVGKEIRVE